MIRILSWLAAIALVIFGMVKCNQSAWYQKEQAESTAQRIARQTPHVIREADGCKVYAFEGGDVRTHYFTRCPDSHTTTESSWTENCGKGCTRTRTETIPN